jgi:hypothetical protein
MSIAARQFNYELVLKQTAFEHIKGFTSRLKSIEEAILYKRSLVLGAKAFYIWTNKFHQMQDKYLKVYNRSLKQRAFRQLDITRKQAMLKCLKVDGYYRKKLVLKAFFGLLKFVEARKKSAKKLQRVQTQKAAETTPLGLVKVVPVIDKEVDEAYVPARTVQTLPDVIRGESEERCLIDT